MMQGARRVRAPATRVLAACAMALFASCSRDSLWSSLDKETVDDGLVVTDRKGNRYYLAGPELLAFVNPDGTLGTVSGRTLALAGITLSTTGAAYREQVLELVRKRGIWIEREPTLGIDPIAEPCIVYCEHSDTRGGNLSSLNGLLIYFGYASVNASYDGRRRAALQEAQENQLHGCLYCTGYQAVQSIYLCQECRTLRLGNFTAFRENCKRRGVIRGEYLETFPPSNPLLR